MLPAGNHKGRFYKPFVMTLHYMQSSLPTTVCCSYKPFVMTLPLPAVTLQLVCSRATAALQSHYKGLKAQSTAICSL